MIKLNASSRFAINLCRCKFLNTFQFHLSTMADTGITAAEISKPENKLSKRAQRKQKRLIAKERRKELKKLNKGLTKNQDPGFDNSLFTDTEYYFENGLRKVYPYFFTFSTFVKRRWVGKTVLDLFVKEFHGTETEEYIDAIECGRVKVNGKNVSKDYVVKDNEYIQHTLHRHENPVDGKPLQIIADDDDVVVINKPASIPCHPCGRYRFNTICFILGKEYGYPNLRNLYRLDRLTSGVLILGKTAESTRKYEDHISKRQVQKEYVCRVVGEFPEGEVVCDQPLEVIDHKITLFKASPTGKESTTKFRRLSYNGTSSVVKCFPLTGRTHQIRVHLQYLGHPIINDPLYNSPAFGPNRGKGGEFWKSEKKMLSEMQNLHNVGLWYEGENPLYHKRMKEIKEKEYSNSQSNETSETCVKNDDTVSCSEPETKKLKLENTTNGQEKDHINIKSSSECTQSIASNTLRDESSHENDGCEPCKKELTHDVAENKEEKFISNDKALYQGSSKFDSIEYKPFDESKWIPDEKCSSCKRNYIEPSPHHLVMFLHALSYKGPDWEYSTEMPDWAKDDWVDKATQEDSNS